MTKKPAKEFRRFLPSNYRKRNVFHTVTNSVALNGRYWSGGSKTVYVLYRADGTTYGFADLPYMATREQMDERYAIGDGETVVALGTFDGKTATAHIYTKGN
jgi:hypothetical protein